MRIVTYDQIGTEIDRKRKKAGLNIEDFAKKHGMTRVAMSKIINGHVQPSKAARKSLGVEPVYRVG